MPPKKLKVKDKTKKSTEVRTGAPNIKTAVFRIVGTSPYVQSGTARKVYDNVKAK
jgi:hypothetical protein